MIYPFKKAKFVKSVVDMKDKPDCDFNEITIVGKSNVGKSSLINALTNNQKLAFTSKKPGHTRLLNYYLIDDSFYIVDCPGYGYSAKKDVDYEFYGNMVESFFKDNNHLRLIIFLLDSRHAPTNDDKDFYEYLKSKDYPFLICFTKSDKLNQSEKARIIKNLNSVFNDSIEKKDTILTSIKNSRSIEELKERINNYLK